MRARAARFVTSAADPAQFPPATLPEIAFAGRSNVGKSSLINALTGVASLARTSRTPGRTRLLNWFWVTTPRGTPVHFVDLPGYGYADVPLAVRDAWRPLIEAFLAQRSELRAVVLLFDIRRGAGDEEIDFAAWLAARGIPLVTVVTKADKVAKNKRKPLAAAIKRDLGLAREPILVSTQEGEGLDEVWRALQAVEDR